MNLLWKMHWYSSKKVIFISSNAVYQWWHDKHMTPMANGNEFLLIIQNLNNTKKKINNQSPLFNLSKILTHNLKKVKILNRLEYFVKHRLRGK